MIKKQYVSYSIDKATKREAEKIIRKLGFTPSSMVNVLYEKIIEDKKVPFVTVQNNKKENVGYNCRVDRKTKEGAEKIIKAAGLTPTSVFNMLYNEIIKHQGLPFEVKTQLNDEVEEDK